MKLLLAFATLLSFSAHADFARPVRCTVKGDAGAYTFFEVSEISISSFRNGGQLIDPEDHTYLSFWELDSVYYTTLITKPGGSIQEFLAIPSRFMQSVAEAKSLADLALIAPTRAFFVTEDYDNHGSPVPAEDTVEATCEIFKP